MHISILLLLMDWVIKQAAIKCEQDLSCCNSNTVFPLKVPTVNELIRAQFDHRLKIIWSVSVIRINCGRIIQNSSVRQKLQLFRK